jgi:hypothetical protein
MRLLNYKTKRFFDRKSIKGSGKRRTTSKLKHLDRKYELINASRFRNKRRNIQKPLVFQLPKTLSISKNPKDTLKFFDDFRNAALPKKRPIQVEFKTMQHTDPSTLLVLASELDRWRRIHDLKLRPIEIEKWNPVIRKYLYQKGLFNLLDVTGYEFLAENKLPTEYNHLPFYFGETLDGKLADDFANRVEKTFGNIENKTFFYDALTEAMQNVGHHAYPRKKTHQIENGYWMSASHDTQNNALYVAFYDQGIGIPNTLPESKLWNQVTSYLTGRNYDDVSLIEAVVTTRKTSKSSNERGHGFSDLFEFAKLAKYGHLRVVSGRGDYISYSDNTQKSVSMTLPLGGTLVEWYIKR